ncbi:hypothetical protein FHW12_000314 [Dokdonella fugitiva]|uniref:Uncharacterized protein n=1 Tax=Dokdonella fugitiva TaxID=328517 RepID=A0A839EU37_9GAMM|nr:hypothetical protein [Dokdonella fugitiva]MBA8886123.1 hypothetical protein [Dokdonella fugitiva]
MSTERIDVEALLAAIDRMPDIVNCASVHYAEWCDAPARRGYEPDPTVVRWVGEVRRARDSIASILAEVIERRARDAAVAELVEAVKKALTHSDRVRDERHFGLRDKPTQAHYNRIVAALAAIQGSQP